MNGCETDTSSYVLNTVVEEKLEASLAVETAVEQDCPASERYSVEKGVVVADIGVESLCPENVSCVDRSAMEVDGDNCESMRSSPANNCEACIENEPESQNQDARLDLVGWSGVGEEAYIEPKDGVEFENEDHAYKCYSRYAVLEGFSIRKDFVNKSRINGVVVSRRYTCYRQGYCPTNHVANVKKPRQETRTGCMAHLTIARQPNGKFRVTHFETQHNHDFVTASTTHILPSQKRLTFALAVESESTNESVMDVVPKLGMGFDSEDNAYEFYNAYAGRIGFSVRKDYINRSKIDGAVASRRFTCFREGFRQKDKRDLNVKRPRKETRIGCTAQLVISRQPDGKYRVTHFEEKHNHELVAASKVHTLRSQKRLATADAEGNGTDASTMQLNSESHDTLGDQSVNVHQRIKYDAKLPLRRMRDIKEGEAEKMQQYFQSKKLKNPSFFYSMQVDAEEQITNIFWADAKMLADYSDFGDVVCVDTTYRLHIDCRPFVAFIGVNHHKEMVIFGAAFLYDETVESYRWLFQTFTEAMAGRKPKTVLTDQDALIAEAIGLVLSETQHCACAWHMYQNAVRQLNHLVVGSTSFITDLSSCFFEQEDDESFVDSWNKMLDAYGLWENEWLHQIFKEREKWAVACGRNNFSADIVSVLFRKGFIPDLRKYLKFDLDVISFLKHLGKILNDWHYKELEANYDMNQKLPRLMADAILLKQARDVYTPKIFELFQQEYETSLNALIYKCSESGPLFEYNVSIYGQTKEYKVAFSSSEETVACNCMKFEFMGVLCSHALKVLDFRNIKLLPERFILKRWTKDARV